MKMVEDLVVGDRMTIVIGGVWDIDDLGIFLTVVSLVWCSSVVVFQILIFDTIIAVILRLLLMVMVHWMSVWWRRRALVAIIAGFARYTVVANAVEVFTKTRDTGTGEDAEDVTLMLVELWRRFSAVDCQIFSKEGLDTGQTEMSEARAVVEQHVNPLRHVSSYK